MYEAPFHELITTLNTSADNKGTLDKEATSYDDIFDAFRLDLTCHDYPEHDA